jgi:hypothetical protein
LIATAGGCESALALHRLIAQDLYARICYRIAVFVEDERPVIAAPFGSAKSARSIS